MIKALNLVHDIRDYFLIRTILYDFVVLINSENKVYGVRIKQSLQTKQRSIDMKLSNTRFNHTAFVVMNSQA